MTMQTETPAATPRVLPWFVIVNPDWYDESEGDAGYAWSGTADDVTHAVNQALQACWADNESEEELPSYDPAAFKQDGFTVYDVTPDFHALARDLIKARRAGDQEGVALALADLDTAVTIRESL